MIEKYSRNKIKNILVILLAILTASLIGYFLEKRSINDAADFYPGFYSRHKYHLMYHARQRTIQFLLIINKEYIK